MNKIFFLIIKFLPTLNMCCFIGCKNTNKFDINSNRIEIFMIFFDRIKKILIIKELKV